MARNPLTIHDAELYNRLSAISGHRKEVVRDVILALSEFVMDELKNDIPVSVGKLGIFSVKHYKSSGGYSFKTGVHRPIGTCHKISFKPSAQMNKTVKGNGNFEEK